MSFPLESTAFGAAVVFGFRHGFDWDHLAALTDLTGSQTRPRRALGLATFYALGHALMVLALGALAIVFAAKLPDGIDIWMERFVGASLIALGVWIVFTTIRTGAAAPPRSRWMVIIDLTRRAVGRIRGHKTIVIEHEHPHSHEHPLHEHTHVAHRSEQDGLLPVRGGVIAPVGHAHRHRHVLPVATDPFGSYTSWSAFGIGLLHGIGAETPTQVVLFAAAANATDAASSLGMLLCFIAGLLGANTVVAVGSAFGYQTLSRNRIALGVLAAVTAGFSFVIGGILLFGRGDVLPSIFGG